MVEGATFFVLAADTVPEAALPAVTVPPVGGSSDPPALDSRSGLTLSIVDCPFGGSPPRGVGVDFGGVVLRGWGVGVEDVREERMEAAEVFLAGCCLGGWRLVGGATWRGGICCWRREGALLLVGGATPPTT